MEESTDNDSNHVQGNHMVGRILDTDPLSPEDVDSDNSEQGGARASEVAKAVDASTTINTSTHGTSSHGLDDAGSVDTGVSPSTALGGTARHPSGQDNISVSIARKENSAVLAWRMVVFAVLLISTVGVAVAVFYYIDQGEQENFQMRFSDDSFKTLDALGNALDLKLGAIDAFVVSLVSYATSFNKSWPFVTIDDHAVRASKIRSLSNAIAIEQYQLVTGDIERLEWEKYAVSKEQWVLDAVAIQANDHTLQGPQALMDDVATNISSIHFDGYPVPFGKELYAPSWQAYPIVPDRSSLSYNWDALQHPKLGPAVAAAVQQQMVVISRVLNSYDPDDEFSDESVDSTNAFAKFHVKDGIDYTEPLVRFLYPVLNTASSSVSAGSQKASKVVAVVATSFYWGSFLREILPAGELGLVAVISNACNQSFSYQINGPDVVYLGPGDLHDRRYSDVDMTFSSDLNDLSAFNTGERLYSGLPMSTEFCRYKISTYPSETMENQSRTADPYIFMIVAILIFTFTSMVFILYDKLVAIRQRKVMKTAVQSTAIVSSLFPSTVRDRLYKDADGGGEVGAAPAPFQPTKLRLKSFLNDGSAYSETSVAQTNHSHFGSRPIADLFTDCTVSFSDIANFTAWSSVREPGQVFTLLETIYGAFDGIAARRGVFKVETIGDSYVAVTGLPEPRGDHAVVMAKFARDCRSQFAELCRKLEVVLGPETAELSIRIGLHSGPVTAGVLRGQKSRFQLFGDTVNTAARMESTGKVNRIQVSQTTADLLVKSSKGHWLKARDEPVEVKGKGTMQTFWVEPSSRVQECTRMNSAASAPSIDEKAGRLINWNVDVLAGLLKKIIAHRNFRQNSRSTTDGRWEASKTRMVLEEVKEIIQLPDFDPLKSHEGEDFRDVVLDCEVVAQLTNLVADISQLYHNNPFHNFEHASHVCMSVAKLMSRIVAPDHEFVTENERHDHTYGITSDPLTQFACVFAALIHDADHPGVPNSQLVKEKTEMAEIYKNKSVAEQNSVNLAWNLLMDSKYERLRDAICVDQQETIRFRQLVVNAVMATDILDKDLKKLREGRWERAFSKNSLCERDCRDAINRKATIVIEHLIQASDVAHTMQHWHIYRNWNERLFLEMHRAFEQGRAEQDPSETWYKGELLFFDYYIIPLARKLSDCGVFGVSSDEYLDYAVMNRNEWEKKGKDVVASMIEKLKEPKPVASVAA